MQKIITLIALIMGISNAPCIANGAGKIYVSHEIAINVLQKEISFWELIKNRSAFIGYGKRQLAYISAFLLACACLPFKEIGGDARGACVYLAFLVHVPRGLLRLQNYFIDFEIGILRNQIKRLVSESVKGIELGEIK